MLGKGNRYIQVKVSKMAYDYIKKYSDMFGVSISQFCSSAVTDKIISKGALSRSALEQVAKAEKLSEE